MQRPAGRPHDGKAGTGVYADGIGTGQGIVHDILQDDAGSGQADARPDAAEDPGQADCGNQDIARPLPQAAGQDLQCVRSRNIHAAEQKTEKKRDKEEQYQYNE